MQKLLSKNLTDLATLYVGHVGISLSTLSERAAGDWKFFDLVSRRQLNFRVRSYDRAVAWFSANWPEGLAWPYHVPRPSPDLSTGDKPAVPQTPEAGTPSADALPPASAEPPSAKAEK